MVTPVEAVAWLLYESKEDASLATISVEDLSLVLATATVALAIRTESTPRLVLDAMWQTHLSDEKWRAIVKRYGETHGE